MAKKNPAAKDPVAFIKTADAPDFKIYLTWRLKNSRITREQSLDTYWKVLSMYYMRTAMRYVDEGIMLDIHNVCGLL
jgi:hypothetical protein